MAANQSAHDLIQFSFTSNGTFTMERIHFGFQGSDEISTTVDTLRVYGMELKDEQIPPEASYNPYSKVLEFSKLNYDWHKRDYYSLNFTINS
jgi:hypothetical protein